MVQNSGSAQISIWLGLHAFPEICSGAAQAATPQNRDQVGHFHILANTLFTWGGTSYLEQMYCSTLTKTILDIDFRYLKLLTVTNLFQSHGLTITIMELTSLEGFQK